MINWRKYTVIGLILCLLHLTLADVGLSANETRLPNPGLTKQQVGQFGVGANVKIELASGKKLKGSIQSVEEAGFLLASNNARPPTRVAYDEVTQLKLAKVTYNAKGRPDAAEAKRVAAGLGVGRHIMVKTAEGREYHGKIVSLDAESFKMLPDHTTAPVQVAYNDVQQIGPNTGRTGWIVALAVVGAIVVILMVLASKMGG